MLIKNIEVDNSKNWVIFDLEDTISKVTEERKKLAENKQWNQYFESCVTDKINQPVVDLLKKYKELGFNIGILTGRIETYSDLTIQFLNDNNVPYNLMKMRSQSNKIPDKNWKPSAVKKYFQNKEGDNIELIVDDRDPVLENLEKKGFKTLDAKTIKEQNPKNKNNRKYL